MASGSTAAAFSKSMSTPAIDTARRVLRLEAEALARLADSIAPEFETIVDLLAAIKGRVIVAGLGKSGHVARKIAATLASTGTPAQFLHAGEAAHGDLGIVTGDDAVLALSRSGETAELAAILSYCARVGAPVIAMTAQAESTLARAARHVLLLTAAEEACAVTAAPTTSTTLQMALGDALAVALLEKRGLTAEAFQRFHPGGQLGAKLLKIAALMQREALPLLPIEAPLSLALEAMTAAKLGCVGGADARGALVGMLTDGDVRRLFLRAEFPLSLADAMTRQPLTFAPDQFAGEALRAMNERGVSQAFVVDASGKPIGVVHLHQMLRAGVG